MDLVALRMGVRVDCEGKLEMDYHTAQNVYKASGGIKDTELSRRYYLADAVFLVGLEGEDSTFLEELYAALQDPHWLLYLGRKAFVPSPPVWLPDGLRKDESLLDALVAYPLLGSGDPLPRLRLVLDDPDGEQVRPDLPISFAKRRFAPRRVTTRFLEIPFPSKEVT
jgi:CRISPR system Cascade subunit CasD